jgi:hypothetical protein
MPTAEFDFPRQWALRAVASFFIFGPSHVGHFETSTSMAPQNRRIARRPAMRRRAARGGFDFHFRVSRPRQSATFCDIAAGHIAKKVTVGSKR